LSEKGKGGAPVLEMRKRWSAEKKATPRGERQKERKKGKKTNRKERVLKKGKRGRAQKKKGKKKMCTLYGTRTH